MTFWKDKEGNELTFKEFMARWKSGIESVNPLQQTKMQIWSTLIILIGIICGIIMTALAFKSAWWLTIILVGALFNTSIQFLGLWQKKKLLERFTVQEPKPLLSNSPSKIKDKDKEK